MCGIVGAISTRPVKGILLEGLKRLEYRGYDSAGVAFADAGGLDTTRVVGKVAQLAQAIPDGANGVAGIAHTRWATHGRPTQANAHPHCSGHISVVHNGIIENYQALRSELKSEGYRFVSETDSEAVAHLMHRQLARAGDNMLQALKATIALLEGAYALVIVNAQQPDALYVARQNSPLVIGVGIGEHFIASDQLALRPVTDRFVFLEEGDYGLVRTDSFELFHADHGQAQRSQHRIEEDAGDADRGPYRHFMLKEIHEQPAAIARTIEGRLGKEGVLVESFGLQARQLLTSTQNICIVACGTSYHAGLIARYWIEQLAKVPVTVEIASEYRYREILVQPNSLFISVSQSGETADTLAALRKAKGLGYLGYLAVCNVTSSTLVRESDLLVATNAGPEIGVASTKAFTTQLTAFLLLVGALRQCQGKAPNPDTAVAQYARSLKQLSQQVLSLEPAVEKISLEFAGKSHALFLGRGVHYPVALEGALKLKEISYIHAEAYPAGELKHGPLALVDEDMPVIAVAPSNDLLEKLKSNLEEVKARGGKLYVFADKDAGFESDANTTLFDMPHVPQLLEPIVYSIPLQLLAYHIALVKGTDVDQPRNLAKSVTVE